MGKHRSREGLCGLGEVLDMLWKQNVTTLTGYVETPLKMLMTS